MSEILHYILRNQENEGDLQVLLKKLHIQTAFSLPSSTIQNCLPNISFFFFLIKPWCEFSLWADGRKYIKFKIWNSRWCEQTHKSYDMFFWLDKQTTTLKTRVPLQIAAFCEIHLLLVFFNSCLKLAVPRNIPARRLIN